MLNDGKKLHVAKILKDRRKTLDIGQAELGCAVWDSPRLSETAAQARISRIENGRLWPTPMELFKIMGKLRLGVEDLVLVPSSNENTDDSGIVRLLPELAERYPELSAHINVLNTYQQQGRPDGVQWAYEQMIHMLNAGLEQEGGTQEDPPLKSAGKT